MPKRMPDAYMVKFFWGGQEQRFITLERSNAETYAVNRHGTIHGLYLEENMVEEIVAEIARPCKENRDDYDD